MAPSRIAYLGPPGTFCEQALWALLESGRSGPVQADTFPVATVVDAVDSVRRGDVDTCLVPLENSVEGGVGVLHDELVTGAPLAIVAQVLLEVSFNLYVSPGSGPGDSTGMPLGDIRTIATHPHAYAQCRGWVRRYLPESQFVPTASTADAASSVREGEYDTAICAIGAGMRYELTAAAQKIEDNPGAVTRFVQLAPEGQTTPEATGNDLTSMAVSLPHDRAGSLAEALGELASRGINLTRIESRPTKKMLGHYWFFLDAEGHVADVSMAEAVAALRKASAELRFLGSYAR